MVLQVEAAIAHLLPIVRMPQLVTALMARQLSPLDRIQLLRLLREEVDDARTLARREGHEEGVKDGRRQVQEEATADSREDELAELRMRITLRQPRDVLILLERYFPELAGIESLFPEIAR